MYRNFKPPFFSGPSNIAGPVGCQSSFCLMKIPMLLRPARAAQRSEAREVCRSAFCILILPGCTSLTRKTWCKPCFKMVRPYRRCVFVGGTLIAEFDLHVIRPEQLHQKCTDCFALCLPETFEQRLRLGAGNEFNTRHDDRIYPRHQRCLDRFFEVLSGFPVIRLAYMKVNAHW